MHVIKSVTKSLAVPFFILCLAACSLLDGQGGADQYTDDATLATRVKQALAADPHVKEMQINVEATDGEIQLSGFVDSHDTEAKAVHLAEQVRGVSLVKDSMVTMKDSVVVAPAH